MDENLGLERGHMKRAFTGDGQATTRHSSAPRSATTRRARGPTSSPASARAHRRRRRHPAFPGRPRRRPAGSQGRPVERRAAARRRHRRQHRRPGVGAEQRANGRYRSAWHRVLPMRDGNRRSVALFYNPAFEATISPAPAAADGGAYPEYVFGDYMDVYNKQKFDAKSHASTPSGRQNLLYFKL
ncbi:hypothetical protein GUJ93_ZPchr0005g16248 [Zizania palustris]|uniref:Isopenicillin N synthase-like Fe(2+) 2OG dioxygenase domain-containing protein n=1 Tax=Zizania palustris TaxID=103762 RepID=A0A8J5S8J9_ZIZPA|nr:hypothetical protein GUJ93_ZPchr0005g16248 [Zizania palustris]